MNSSYQLSPVITCALGFPLGPKSRIYENTVPCGHLQAAKDNYRRLYEITESSGWTQVEDLAPGGRDKSNKSLHLTLPHYLFTLYTHMHTKLVKWQWDCWNLASFPVPVCKRRSKRERKQMFNQFTSDRERKRPLEGPRTTQLIPHLPYSQPRGGIWALLAPLALSVVFFIDLITMLPVFELVFLCRRGSRLELSHT